MERSTFPLVGAPRHRPGETDGRQSLDLGTKLEGCLCHVYKNERGELTPFTERSWRTFVHAATLRKDDVWERLLSANLEPDLEHSAPRGSYHRRCYQAYTHRKTLQALEPTSSSSTAASSSQSEETCTDAGVDGTAGGAVVARPEGLEDVVPTRRTTRSMTSKTDILACLFCQQKGWKNRGSRVKRSEGLSQCLTFQAAETVMEAANIREDERVLMQIQGGPDAIAAEVRYHKSCYSAYTDKRALQSLEEAGVAEEDSSAGGARSKFWEAFMILADEVEAEILAKAEEANAIKISDLRKRYITLLEEAEIHSDYRAARLKLRLQSKFAERIKFVPGSSVTDSEVVVSSDVPTDILLRAAACAASGGAAGHGCEQSDGSSDADALEEIVDPPAHGPDLMEMECRQQLFNTAMFLRGVILSMKNTVPPVPRASDLLPGRIDAPVPLYNFLVWLLAGCDGSTAISMAEPAQASESCRRHALSILQDLVHCTTHGRIRTCKHLALPMTVRHLTRSEQVITLLNQFGHGYSSSKVVECETALAEDLLGENPDECHLPAHIDRNLPVIFCWDNNDLAEETLSGGGTTHCTNGIVIQRGGSGASHTVPCQMPKRQRKRRSLKVRPVPPLEYNAGARCGPQPAAIPDDLNNNSPAGDHEPPSQDEGAQEFEKAVDLDMLWLLLRISQQHSKLFGRSQAEKQEVPAWSGFNSLLAAESCPSRSTIGYLPVIPESPTEMVTVNELLRRSCLIAARLGQSHAIITVDQPIYAKAQEIVWKHQEDYKQVVLRMGAFHVSCAFLAAIGKRFGDAGLQDLLVESGVIGPSAVDGVLSGKQYNRGLRAHKLLFEAFQRLKFDAMEATITCEQDDNVAEDFTDLHDRLQAVRSQPSQSSIRRITTCRGFELIKNTWMDEDSGDVGAMTKFWRSYPEMVNLLLCFVRATRLGNWPLHLTSIRKMLPWFFAYDHIHYARWLSVYWWEMVRLPKTHPEAHALLASGEFCVQRSTDGSASQVAIDQCIEQTMNRDSKTRGGIVGYSLHPGAVQRWIVTAHERASIAGACHDLAKARSSYNSSSSQRRDDCQPKHKDNTPTRIARDEADICKLVDIAENWINPFTVREQSEIVHLATGATATTEIKEDLLGAYEKGEKAFTVFLEERLETSSTPFHDAISAMKLKRFKDLSAKSVKVGSKEIVLKADRALFARLLIMAQRRAIDLRQLFSYSLGPIPWSLASTDGTPAKTVKSKLLHLIESGVKPTESTPLDAAWLVDGMAVLQALPVLPHGSSFSDLAGEIFLRVTSAFGKGCQRIDFVVDQYPEVSIKGCERQRRARSGSVRTTILNSQQQLPRQWKKYLSNGKNKGELATFLVKEWQDKRFAKELLGKQLFTTAGQDCYCLSSSDGSTVRSQRVEQLSGCAHEEADTRLLLHAGHAAENGYAESGVVIKSPDTDVAVLACDMCAAKPAFKIFFLTGTKQRTRFIPIHAVAAKLGANVSSALLGLHAFTGCDSTSAFVGKGKSTGLQLIQSNPQYLAAMQQLGQSFQLSDATHAACEEFTCALYGRPGQSVNELRYNLFCLRAPQCHQLPPTKDALSKHVARANYQAAIWRRSQECSPQVPDPDGHGWLLKEGELVIDWMSQNPAPKEVLEFIACGCKSAKGCSTARCSCVKNGLPCTDCCGCTECRNETGPAVSSTLRSADDDDDEFEEAAIDSTAASGDEYPD